MKDWLYLNFKNKLSFNNDLLIDEYLKLLENNYKYLQNIYQKFPTNDELDNIGIKCEKYKTLILQELSKSILLLY